MPLPVKTYSQTTSLSKRLGTIFTYSKAVGLSFLPTLRTIQINQPYLATGARGPLTLWCHKACLPQLPVIHSVPKCNPCVAPGYAHGWDTHGHTNTWFVSFPPSSKYMWLLTHCWWSSLVAQAVKNLPAKQEPQETEVLSLGGEDPLEEEIATHFSVLPWRNPINSGAWGGYSLWGNKELDTTEVT